MTPATGGGHFFLTLADSLRERKREMRGKDRKPEQVMPG